MNRTKTMNYLNIKRRVERMKIAELDLSNPSNKLKMVKLNSKVFSLGIIPVMIGKTYIMI